MNKKILLLALLNSFAMFSQTIFQDNLSNYTTGQILSGQGTWTNNSSSAGTGACAGAICTNSTVLTPGFSYTNFGTSTKSLQLLSDTDGCGTMFTSVTSGDMYVGFMINVSSAATSPNDFFRVNNGNSFVTGFRIFIKTVSANTFTIGISKGAAGNAVVYTTNMYAFNQDCLLILKYSQLSGTADDILNLYVNPIIANGVPSSPDATTGFGTDQSGTIDRLVFRQNATATPTGRAGLVSVARSWTGLIFPNMSVAQFEKEVFTINSKNAKNGLLAINSNTNLENASLSIYSLDGKLLENRTIRLIDSENSIAINPIQNGGVYIVSIKGNGVNSNQKIYVE
jgi:hypothetical protein